MNFKNAVLLIGFLFLFYNSVIYGQTSDSTYNHYKVTKDINVNRIDFAQEEFGFVKSSNLNSTEDILNRFGVSFIRRGNYAPEPVIRGLNTNQIDVTVNGMKVMSACTDKMDPVTSYVETENLGEVEIESGTGDGSFLSKSGGRIDLGLYKPVFSKSFKYYGNFKSGYQFASDNYKGSLNLNLSNDFFTANVNGSYNIGGDYKTGGGTKVWNSGFEKYNISLNGSYKINENNFINLNGIIDDAYDIGFPALLMDVGSAKARIIGLDYQSGNFLNFFRNFDLKVYYNN
ncbi:MAG: TonB-dependent receptor plug domain-containing protein, partial [Ignavibacteria bacterium]